MKWTRLNGRIWADECQIALQILSLMLYVLLSWKHKLGRWMFYDEAGFARHDNGIISQSTARGYCSKSQIYVQIYVITTVYVSI